MYCNYTQVSENTTPSSPYPPSPPSPLPSFIHIVFPSLSLPTTPHPLFTFSSELLSHLSFLYHSFFHFSVIPFLVLPSTYSHFSLPSSLHLFFYLILFLILIFLVPPSSTHSPLFFFHTYFPYSRCISPLLSTYSQSFIFSVFPKFLPSNLSPTTPPFCSDQSVL